MNFERYQRQMLLPELGFAGQQRLLAARVLVIGAGGLGCPVLQYLAAAGVGTIGIIDDDTVSMSNLHRQILYTVADIGRPKAIVAAERLQQMNPDIIIQPFLDRLDIEKALELFPLYDLVVDGSDNFPTRYVVNDICAIVNKPLVYGAISQFEGQVAVFNCPGKTGRSVNYRDLFPHPPAPGEVRSCAEAGVIGVLPGIIGTLQANEVIKLITGIGSPLINQVLIYSALTNKQHIIMMNEE
jgi:adenylyltransferase/sulfurtransferase